MIRYFCRKCGETVGQSQKPVLKNGATIICAECLELHVLNLFVVGKPLPQEGTEEHNNQMAAELEGSFLLLGGEDESL